MNQKTDEKLDQLTGKLLKTFSAETPSFDFTTKVMSRVEGLSTSTVTAYQPLIAKKTWMVLIIFVMGILAFAIFGNIHFENSWATFFKPESLPKLGSLALPYFEMSNVLIYGIVGFTFFTVVQIFILKHQFNKRFALH